MMWRICYILLFVVAFGLKRISGESVYPSKLFPVGFDNLRFRNSVKTSVFNIPSSVKDLYRIYALNDGTGKRNTEKITVHCFTGQGNVNISSVIEFCQLQ